MRWRLLPNEAHDAVAHDPCRGPAPDASPAEAPRGPTATTAQVLFDAPPAGHTWWPAAVELPRDRGPSAVPFGAASGRPSTLARSAARCLGPWLADAFPADRLFELCARALPDEPRLVQLDEHTWILELFHGPTAAFKDTGARVLATLVEAALADDACARPAGRATVLAATTGDTGAAVAAAFEGVADLDVVLLYPRGKISPFQECHLLSFGAAVRAFAVEGDFADCARLAGEITAHEALLRERWWLPANSVHPLRLLPQAAHFLWAAERLEAHGVAAPAFVVPSGNLGHLTAGLAARLSGLRSSGWIAAHNANRACVDWLAGGRFEARATSATWSNAMDIAAPGNRARLAELLRHEPAELVGESVNDGETLAAMAELQRDHGYGACPHTAVGWAALRRRRDREPAWRGRPAVLLATAHPAKFAGARRAAGLEPLPLPPALEALDRAANGEDRASNDRGEARVAGLEELQRWLS
jgi:threonine synthase